MELAGRARRKAHSHVPALRWGPTIACQRSLTLAPVVLGTYRLSQQRNRVRGDCLATADRVNALVRLALDADGVGGNPERRR